jgi:hypothetical protein
VSEVTSPDQRSLAPRHVAPLVDFVFRLAFFAAAPFAIVLVAALFPVRGAIIDASLAVVIFVAAERARRWAARSRFLKWLFDAALEFESYYRTQPPRPFLYYLFYPLLLPYWLIQRDARREFLVFRGYTIGGLLVLLASLVWQYFTRFVPELGLREFLPQVWLTLIVEMLLALSLLMPIATSFVCYHGGGQRWRLNILLAVGLISSLGAVYHVVNRRDPIVSYATGERVSLRTKADRRKAHQTLITAVRAARTSLLKSRAIEGDGKVMGEPLEAARRALLKYYKSDEVLAFDIWASPRTRPRAIVLYFEAGRSRRPIWVAVDGYGSEIRGPNRLPKGAFTAMRSASDGTEALLDEWPETLELDILPGQ